MRCCRLCWSARLRRTWTAATLRTASTAATLICWDFTLHRMRSEIIQVSVRLCVKESRVFCVGDDEWHSTLLCRRAVKRWSSKAETSLRWSICDFCLILSNIFFVFPPSLAPPHRRCTSSRFMSVYTLFLMTEQTLPWCWLSRSHDDGSLCSTGRGRREVCLPWGAQRAHRPEDHGQVFVTQVRLSSSPSNHSSHFIAEVKKWLLSDHLTQTNQTFVFKIQNGCLYSLMYSWYSSNLMLNDSLVLFFLVCANSD